MLREDVFTTFFPWAGGKRRLLPDLEANTPTHFDRYHEPFLGAGAFALHLMESREKRTKFVLGDLNQELIYAWEAVRDVPEELIIETKDLIDRHSIEHFKTIRNKDRTGELGLLTPLERAARFLYIMAFAFGGVYSTDSNGNCSSSATQQSERPPSFYVNRVRYAHYLMSKHDVSFYTRSFSDGLDEIAPGDFLYMDPPYATDRDDGRPSWSGYQAGNSERQFQVAVKAFASAACARGAYVLASNASTPTTRELWGRWPVASKPFQYSVQSAGRKSTEVLFGNDLISAAIKRKQQHALAA